MSVGLYGKYPAKRDFVVVNIPHAVLQPLEKWIQSALAASREKLRASWAECYMIQPIWNFRLGSSITGVDCIGAMAPSVDGVGRAFPLVILSHASPGSPGYPPLGSLKSSDWFPEVHGRLLLALDEEAPADPIMLLDGLSEPRCEPLHEAEGLNAIAGGHRIFCADGELDQTLGKLSEYHCAKADEAMSVWWTSGGDRVRGQAVSFRGMPDVLFMAEMMSGDTGLG